MLSMQELSKSLAHFHGTDSYHIMLPEVVITDGVLWLCEQAECFWLVSLVYSYQTIPRVRREPFQVYDLGMDLANREGIMTCTDGNGQVLLKRSIPFTDFPLIAMTLWYSRLDGVLYLPSEH